MGSMPRIPDFPVFSLFPFILSLEATYLVRQLGVKDGINE